MDNIPWLDTQFPHQAYPGDNMASGYGYAIAPSAYPQLPPQSYAEPPSQLASSFDNAGIGGGAAYLFSSSPEPYLDVPAGNRVSTSPMLARSAPATLHVPPPANQQQQQGLQLQLPQSATAQLQEPSPFFLAQSLPRLALNPPFGPASQPVQPFQAQFQQSPQYQQQYQQPGQQQYQQPTSQQYQRDQQNNHLQLQPQPPPSSSPQLDFQSDFGLGLPQATQIEPGEAPSNSTPMQAQPAAMLRSTSIDPMALFATGPPLGVSRDLSNNRLVSPFTDYATGTNTSLFAGGTSMVRSQSARLPSGTGGLVLRSDPSEVRAAPYTLPSRLPRMPKTPVTPADRRFIAWTWPSPSPGATGTTTQRTTSSPSPPMVSSDGSVGASAGRKRIRAVPVRATPAQRYILDLEFATNQYPTEEVLRRLEREFAPDGNGATVSTLKAWFTDRRSKVNRALRRSQSRSSGWSEGLGSVTRARMEYLARSRGDVGPLDLFPITSFAVGSWEVARGDAEMCVALRPAAFEAYIVWKTGDIIYRLALHVDEIRVTRIARSEKHESPHCRVHVMRNALELHCRTANGGDGWVPARDVSNGAITTGGRIKICGVEDIGKRLTSMLRCSPRVADPAEAIKELWAQPSHILSATEDGAVADGSRGGGGDEAAVGDDNRLPTADVSPHSLVLSEQVSTPNSNSVLDLESLAPGVRSEAIDNGAGNPAADVTGAGVAAIASSSAEAVERPGGGGDEGQLDNALYRLSCFEDWFADSVQDAC